MQHVGRDDAQSDDHAASPTSCMAAVLERREEARPHLQTDREDEENQTELLDEVQYPGGDGHPEMAGCDTDEENPRRPQRHASDLIFPSRMPTV